jgi:hypothetical protein
MTTEQFNRERNYYISIYIAKMMKNRGLISKKEYAKIDTILIENQRPLLGSLQA